MAEVSVIMGVYNCKSSEMLRKSVDSILNQTYENFEFLICNDGSTDNTLLLLNELSKLDSRIKILTYKRNAGLANALNVCIANASGEFIARQDDDDISYPTRLEKQISFLRNHNEYALVGTIADVYDDNGIWGEYIIDEEPTTKSFLWNSPFLHPSIMMRKEALVKSGCYRVAKETRRCEDYDLFMQMYANGYKGYNIQEKLYKYKIVVDNKKYRPMKYRVDEAIVRFKGYRDMGILIRGIPYIVKPIMIGLIPQWIFRRIRKNQYQDRKMI